MTRFRKLLGPLVLLLIVCGASLVLAQGNSIGGVFQTAFNYVIGGQWTWRGQAIPFIFEGTTDDANETSLAVTNPTADRTFTIPNVASDTFVFKASTDTLTNKTLTSPTITGATMTTTTLTSPTITGPTITGFTGYTNTGTILNPTASGGSPTLLHCGTTGSGSQTCAPSTATALTKIYGGRSTLSGNAATITFPVAFTGTTSYDCVANDVTTRANPVQMIAASSTTATITNTTGATDVIQWVCFGN